MTGNKVMRYAVCGIMRSGRANRVDQASENDKSSVLLDSKKTKRS